LVNPLAHTLSFRDRKNSTQLHKNGPEHPTEFRDDFQRSMPGDNRMME
jgi:hypothetical protein